METLIAFIDKISAPLVLTAIALELIISYKEQRELYDKKDTLGNIGSGIIGLTMGLGTKVAAFALFCFLHQFAIRETSLGWGDFALAMFLHEFIFYFYHRFAHEVRFFWAGHITHHSSKKYNFSTAVRIPFHGLYRWLFWVPMAFLVDPKLILLADSLSLTYQFFLHTELRLWKKPGPWGWIFNTASFHSVHHACNPKYMDTNYGGILIIFDRIFGTFQAEEEKPVYGVPHSSGTHNPIMMGMEGWIDLYKGLRREDSLKGKLKYLMQKPGTPQAGKNQVATSSGLRMAKRASRRRIVRLWSVRKIRTQVA